MMSLRVIGIQLNGSFEFALSIRPIVVVIIPGMRERDVRFGEGRIDFHRLKRGGLRLRQRLICWHAASGVRAANKIVSVSQPAVSQCEVGIFFYRLLKISERLLHSFFGALVEVKSPFQIKLISLVAFGVVFGKSTLLARDLEF